MLKNDHTVMHRMKVWQCSTCLQPHATTLGHREVGKAIAIAKNAIKRLQSISTGTSTSVYMFKTIQADMPEVKSLVDTYVRVNDSVSFHSVPSMTTIGNIYPPPKQLLEAKTYRPPPFAFGRDFGVVSYGRPEELNFEQMRIGGGTRMGNGGMVTANRVPQQQGKSQGGLTGYY